MRRWTPIAALALQLAVPSLGAAQETTAQPATAVVPFAGRRADAMRRQVAEAIAERAQVLNAERVDAAAAEREVSGNGDAGVVGLASDLHADLVVQGVVEGSARAPRLELVIRSADGTVLARETIRRGRGGRGAEEMAERVRAVFDGAVTTWSAHQPSAAGTGDGQVVDEEPEPTHPAGPLPEDGMPIFAGTIGLGVRNRSADIRLANGDRRLYESGAFAEIVLTAELRPFANDSHLGRGLYVNADFAHSVGLSSRVLGDPTRPDPVSTNFARFSLNAGWMYPIERIAEVGVSFGFGYDGYFLADMNGVLPTAEYWHVRPAARGRIRLYREAAVLEAEIAYRAVLSVGQLVPDFGNAYGAEGFDLGLGVTGTLIPVMDLGFFYGVRFDWIGYWLHFAGMATDQAANAGSESAFRLTARVGWSFR